MENNSPVDQNLIVKLRQYYDNIIRCMPENVYWVDKNCNSQGCNQNVLDTLGLTIEEFRGRPFAEPFKILIQKGFCSQEAIDSFRKDTEEVIRTGKAKLDVEEPPFRDKDGRIIYFLTSRKPLFDEDQNVIGVVAISVNITERKKAEAEIQEQKERADKESARKSVFLTSIERMIRTVLSSSLGAAQVLSRYEYPFAEASDILKNMIVKPSKKIIPLIRRAHDYLQIQEDRLAGKQNVHTFELPDFFERVIGPFREDAEEAGLLFTLEDDDSIPGWAKGNEDFLTQVLDNILSNALKYTQEGRIKVTVDLIADDGFQYELLFKIADTGRGIQPETKAILFNYLDNEALKYNDHVDSHNPVFSEGGVNLSISAEMVHAMGGEIEVESEVGKGTTFSLRVPLEHTDPDFDYSSGEKEAQSSTPALNMIRSADSQLRFLIIEDSSLALKALEMMLLKKYKNATVDAASTKAEALEAIDKGRYDLIFCDINLPDGNGLDVIRAEHQKHAEKASRCVVVTAYVGDDEGKEAGLAGAIDWVPKPIDMDTVIWMVNTYVLSDWEEYEGANAERNAK
jgi:two-component system aerobic respiration control sensor histidine kinase ArcB